MAQVNMVVFSKVCRLAAWVLAFNLVGCASEPDAEQVAVVRQALAQAVPAGFQEELFLSGRVEPTAVRFAPDGRIFVAEKSGLLWAYPNATDPVDAVRVIDLRAHVHNFWDRGLLGVAVHPQFPAVPHVYVLYTLDSFPDGTTPRWGTGGPNPSTTDNCPSPPGATEQGCVVDARLSRIVVEPTTLLGTEQPLLSGRWCQQYPSHSIGDLAFGGDGYLYVSAGDGASFTFADFGQQGNPCGDPPGGAMTGINAEGGALRSQDLLTPGDPTSFDGTLLRLDVSGPAVTAPPDNPLVGNAVADDDFIVAMGLRNPFRITARPETDELWIADVGWNAWEEINRLEAPTGTVKNYGWPCYEGSAQQSGYASRSLCQALYGGAVPSNISLREPFYAYSHSAQVVAGDGCGTGGSSITGLAFNAGGTYPATYEGALFFADSTRQCIWTMFADANGEPNPTSRAVFVTKASGRIVDLQMGPDGNLYYVDFDGGNVYRIAYYIENTPPVAVLTADPTNGPAPLTVAFDASGSSDVEDGAALSFSWDLDGDGTFGDATGPNVSFTYVSPGQHLASVRVTDSGGLSRIASVPIVVDNTPPVPVIESPLASYQFSANELLSFSGYALDAEDGLLPPEQLSWTVIQHHCASPDDCHTHPVTSMTGVASGTFQAPDHDYPSFLELRLTATDLSSGFWWDTAFSRRIPLQVTANLPSLGVSDVPVLVRLEPARIPYAELLPDGADLRFTDEVGNPLPYEIENWNPNGVSTVWVKLSQLSSASTGQRIYLYYGNPNAADAQEPSAVWSNGYAAVWHLGEALTDSSGNGNQGTAVGALPTAGFLGPAYHFDGVSAYLDMGNSASLSLASTLSLEAFIRIADPNLDSYGRIISKKSVWDSSTGYNLEYNPGLNYLSTLGSGVDYVRAEGVDLDTEWHYVASSINGAAGQLYVNGSVRPGDTTISPVVAGTQALHLGRRSGGGDYFNGAIDEVRISSVARSAAWMAIQNTSMRDALFTFGGSEGRNTLSATTSVIVHPKTLEVSLSSEPPGLALVLGSRESVTPFSETAIDGSLISVSAPLNQMLSGVMYSFEGWSNGGDATQTFHATENLFPLVAFYTTTDTSCEDGIQNGSELGVDCGGFCPPCPSCEDGIQNGSELGIDCGGSCLPCPSCDDGIQNGSELGVDCGGSCPPCPSCDDGIQNGSELGVDCGGSCPPCPSCDDGIQNGSELGIDCGGSCPPCSSCQPSTYEAENMFHSTGGATSDGWNIWGNGYISTSHPFTSGSTTLTVVARGSIAQGVWPNMVVSVGGTPVGNVAVNSSVYSNYVFSHAAAAGSQEVRITFTNDFYSASEDRNLYVDKLLISCPGPGEPSCDDGLRNGTESDVDCGGSCPQKCPNGSDCSIGADCASGVCTNLTCQAPPVGAVTGSITLTNDWGSGYCAELRVTNGRSTPISSWSLSLNTQQSTLYDSWNANYLGSGSLRTVTPLSWNAAIAPGGSTAVGFCANKVGSSWAPTIVSVSGS